MLNVYINADRVRNFFNEAYPTEKSLWEVAGNRARGLKYLLAKIYRSIQDTSFGMSGSAPLDVSVPSIRTKLVHREFELVLYKFR